ncbi:tetratricopeptide repeat protein [Actinoplanes sp. NEAU-A12]|uniref:Tetratricopeptide repeat protein n=1 Tax=Actinoplanes sandaracinus TaxID=3045177 RepID=A0ABT6X1X2_9ACTN|nr:tetratricopeptide repeat protein [Actinoplanes sandaracinus]MDI6105978.1 tetratricopeptide repeat protein [Actinoplanes sandaracinus]
MPLSGDPVATPAEVFTTLPDPGQANSPADLVDRLRRLKVWAGDPSYETIKDRVNAAWTAAGRPAGELTRRSTIAYCFKPGRRRLDIDLLVAVVQALHPDTGYVTAWRQALRVIGGEIEAASQVWVQDSLPQDLAGFTGRSGELDRLRHAARAGEAVVISAIEGMAGVGKTRLAVHAGYLLIREKAAERVLFVNLRGFDPDPAQPPADPAAVLDGFLRLLGMPGQQIPHDLDARAAAYRDRLAGTRTLVVLDNAATTAQVRPLLPNTPSCLTLVTSRRSLADLHPAVHLSVDVFIPDDALAFLTRAVPETPVGPDPHAASRIARRCGYLPLALSLTTGHIRGTPGWTLTDHADRLDERHHQRRLDTGVELALALSYQHLPTDQRRLLRLAALHPGQDLDAYAAAALCDTDVAVAQTHLQNLYGNHLLQQTRADRYTLHDLVRAYATGRASDEDRPPERRAALTRLFDYYLVTTAAAMDALYPAEKHRRPRIPPAGNLTPTLGSAANARSWLDTERPTLVAVAAHTAKHGWPHHTTGLTTTLYRYLDGRHHADALTIHAHALDAAHRTGDPVGQADALTNLGATHLTMGRYGPATEYLQQALHLFQRTDSSIGQARALANLGAVAERLGHYWPATEHHQQALILRRRAQDRTGEASTLDDLGIIHVRLGRYQAARNHHERALTICRDLHDRGGEARSLCNLGVAELLSGRYEPATGHLQQALRLFRQLGNRTGQAWAHDSLGTLQIRLGQPNQATEHYQRALALHRETGGRHGQTWALNGLGEVALAAGRPGDSLAHHRAAHIIAVDTADRHQQARALTGIGDAHHALGNPALARERYQQAFALYTDLGLPEADRIRAHLTALDLTAAGSEQQ